MTTINYTYEIIKVDEANGVMEVVYESPEYGIMHVGARLPYAGESLESVIEAYSPVYDWLDSTMLRETVQVGTKGNKFFDDTTQNQPVDPYSTIIESLPTMLNESVKAIEELNLKNLKIQRVYNKLNTLVGIEILGPVGQASVEEGSTMFNNATLVIDRAKQIGVTVLAKSSNQNIKDFLTNIHNMTPTEGLGGETLFVTEVTANTGKKYIFSSFDFLNRFTDTEKFTIASTANNDAEVKIFYDTMLAVDYVDLTHPMISQGLGLLVSKSLINEARAAELSLPQ